MKRIVAVLAGVALPAVMLAGPAGARTTRAESSCREPVAARDYTAEAMTLTLSVDLAGCRWWREGDPLNLLGTLGRDDGGTPTAEDFVLEAPGCDGEERCTVTVTLPHTTTETAYHFGGFTYQWGPDGDYQLVDLATTCASTPLGGACRADAAPEVRGPGSFT